MPSNIDELSPFCSFDPVRNSAKIRQKLLELKQIAPNAAVLTSTFLESDDTYDSKTDSADKVDSRFLFEPRTNNFDRQKVISYSKEVYDEYQRSYTQVHCNNFCDQTKKHGLLDTWKIHRIGRMTASVSKLAFTTKVKSPSKTFINTVIQYKPSTDVAATKYGKKMEPVAFHASTEYLRLRHENASVFQTVLNVNAEFPHSRATPDGTVSCSCHGKALLEIKFPHKYRNGLSGWDSDPGFSVYSNGYLDEVHSYYYQLQHACYRI